MPSSAPAKRAAACAALSKRKLEVRYSASECSWNWLRTWPARTPSVAKLSFSLIKKPGRGADRVSRHALAAFITRPQAVAQIGATEKLYAVNRRSRASDAQLLDPRFRGGDGTLTLLGRQIQIELRGVLVA